MSTVAEEAAQNPADRFKLSAILAPLVKERVDACMDAYVTKDYLNTVVTKLENRLLMYLGGLVGASLVLTLGGVKLMLPEAVSQTVPAVIVVQPAQAASAIAPAPAVPNPALSTQTH